MCFKTGTSLKSMMVACSKLTNAEIKRIIEDKYGSEIWNRLPCSAKLYNELKAGGVA